MSVQLPAEIWAHVSEFIPSRDLCNLRTVNHLFYSLALDARYRNLEFHDLTTKALRTLSQLSNPAIAQRVRRLELQLYQLYQLAGLEHGETMHPLPSHKGLRHRLTAVLLHSHLSRLGFRFPSTKTGPPNTTSPISPFEALLETLTTVFPLMINVEEFSVDTWANLPTELDLQPFFSAAWTGFGTKVRKLSLGGNIEGFKVLLASQPILPVVEELHLEFTHNINPPAPNSTVALNAFPTIETLLHDFAAPFINSLGAQLKVLKFTSWASIDLSSFFKLLGPFPVLHTLSIRAAFNRSFTNDPSGLAQILYKTSSTLKNLILRLNPARLDSLSDLALCQWLTEIMENDREFACGLQSLQLYPSVAETGLTCLLTFIRRSAGTLERLYVRDRYLLLPEITKITTAFSPYKHLLYLHLNVRQLPVELFDLFSESFPKLKGLGLMVTHGEHALNFITEIQTRQYPGWNLYDIGVWQGGNEVHYGTMILLLQSIPSIGSFWGRGSTWNQGNASKDAV